ncbi:macrophage mannose receptor 1-like isoform X2 [Ptychodera flava]|uniref:macrophage mannose receptor 1-like isoform X2 n=1 Tax=Ptychodera flava TaxID=63121 RepID=UPI003969D2E9
MVRMNRRKSAGVLSLLLIMSEIVFFNLPIFDTRFATFSQHNVVSDSCKADACASSPCSAPAVCEPSCSSSGFICLCNTDVFTGKYCNELALHTDTVSNISYLGCFIEGKLAGGEERRSWAKIESDSTLTPAKCIKFCSNHGIIFAILSGPVNNVNCICDFLYGTKQKVDESSCQTPCPGKKYFKCGGPVAVSVYYTGIPYPSYEAAACTFGNESGAKYGNQCFWVSPDGYMLMDWIRSERDCVMRGGQLAVITDMPTLQFLSYFIFKTPNFSVSGFWIGASTFNKDGEFRFTDIDNTALDTDMFWKPKPDNGYRCANDTDACGQNSDGLVFNGTCYFLVEELYDWTGANFACTRYGGKLATIQSRQTQWFIRRQILLTGTEMDWWFDFQLKDESYVGNNSFFAKDTVTVGHCSKMTLRYNYLWTTDICESENYFVCEEGKIKDNGCAIGWFFNRETCYHHTNMTAVVFEESRKRCMSAGAHLVTISNRTDNQYVTSLINQTCPLCVAFIGYNDIDNDGKFSWDGGIRGEYENWSPSNVFDDANDCVLLDSSDGTWKQTGCSQPNGFVCEMAPFP